MTADWLAADALAPSTTGHLAPFYEAAGRGELAMPFCSACAGTLELEQLVCHRCGRDGPSWAAVEAAGTVHAVTTVHRLEPPLVRTQEPYHVVDVELRSGHRVVMTTSGPTLVAPRIGDEVQVGFRSVGGTRVPAVATHPPDTEVSR